MVRYPDRAAGGESGNKPAVSPAPTPGGGAPPILARIAGLEAEAAAALASPGCLELAARRQEILAELAEARAALVEQIAARLAGFEPELRRFLLAVKRSAFNGRGLRAFTAAAGWPALENLSPHARRTAELEARLSELERAFAELYDRELSRERRQIAARAGDRRFLRGVALGRPGLAEKARAKAPAIISRAPAGQPAKWERSLLRFVTRAATKLSTNSTLTSSAMGALHPAAAPALAFLPRPLREISLVRCHRPEMEQLVELLTLLPAMRDSCLAAWNDTVEEPEPGRFLYLREEHWKYDAEAGRPVLVPRARAAVRLDRAFPAAVRAALAGAAPSRPPTYRELLAALAPEALAPEEGREAARAGLDQLIRLGLVLLLPPWPTHEPRLERRLVQFLRGLPADAGVAAILAAAEDFEALERSFAEAERPEAVVRQIGESFARLLATTREAAGLPAPAAGEGPPFEPEIRLFEEVLAVDAGGDAASPALLSVSAVAADQVLAVASLVSRFASVFNHRHEVLHTLCAWWRREASGQTELDFAEVGRRFAPLWKDFQDFRQAAGNDLAATWNPLQCAGGHRLAEQRRQLLAGYHRLLAASPGRELLDRGALEGLVAAVPAAYAPLLGASAFAQPADAEGCRWVFNNLHEGTGRFLSRLTPVLEGPLESLYLDHLIARSRVEVDGEQAELFEIKYPFGHLVRAHHPQTARALDWRGVNLDLPAERRLRLQDLRVRADLSSESLRLIDGAGRRLLPLHVSTLDEEMLPHLLRILLLFGPGELRNAFPASQVERIGEVVHFRRLSCGPVVLRRAGWAFGLEPLLARTAGLEGAAAHLAVDAWRRSSQLPRQCFYYETIRHGVAGRNKPQYVDFSSPSLVQLFLESARRLDPPRMMAEETLPAPGDYPPGADGRPRGLELLFDPLVAAPAGDGR